MKNVTSTGIVSGTIDKRGIGAEDGRLLDAVVQTHGTDRGAEFLNRMTKMTIDSNQRFLIGIFDTGDEIFDATKLVDGSQSFFQNSIGNMTAGTKIFIWRSGTMCKSTICNSIHSQFKSCKCWTRCGMHRRTLPLFKLYRVTFLAFQRRLKRDRFIRGFFYLICSSIY